MNYKSLIVVGSMFTLGLIGVNARSANAACTNSVNIPFGGSEVSVYEYWSGVPKVHAKGSAAGSSGNANLIYKDSAAGARAGVTTLNCWNPVNFVEYQRTASDSAQGGYGVMVYCDMHNGAYDVPNYAHVKICWN